MLSGAGGRTRQKFATGPIVVATSLSRTADTLDLVVKSALRPPYRPSFGKAATILLSGFDILADPNTEAAMFALQCTIEQIGSGKN